ncbi:MAG: hypothetical protein IJ242_09040 [Clostridia bacterium]|nr:hypothetical protein [Clostridia bacterium]
MVEKRTAELAGIAIGKMLVLGFIDEPHLRFFLDDRGFFHVFADEWLNAVEGKTLTSGERLLILGSQALGSGIHIAKKYGIRLAEDDVSLIYDELDAKDAIEIALGDFGIYDDFDAACLFYELVEKICYEAVGEYPELETDPVLIRQYMEVLFDAGVTIVDEVERRRLVNSTELS